MASREHRLESLKCDVELHEQSTVTCWEEARLAAELGKVRRTSVDRGVRTLGIVWHQILICGKGH